MAGLTHYALVLVVEVSENATPQTVWETIAQRNPIAGEGQAVYLSDPYRIGEPHDEYATEGIALLGNDDERLALTNPSALEEEDDGETREP